MNYLSCPPAPKKVCAYQRRTSDELYEDGETQSNLFRNLHAEFLAVSESRTYTNLARDVAMLFLLFDQEYEETMGWLFKFRDIYIMDEAIRLNNLFLYKLNAILLKYNVNISSLFVISKCIELFISMNRNKL